MAKEQETPPLLSGTRAAEAVGLTYRQVDYLARSGSVVPTQQAAGSGSSRGYDVDDLTLLIVWRDLYKLFGSPPTGIAGSRRVVIEIRKLLGEVTTAYVKKGSVQFRVDLAAARREAARLLVPREPKTDPDDRFQFDNAVGAA